MKAYYINPYNDGVNQYYDLMVEKDGEQVIRLSSINFADNFSDETLINQANDIVINTLPEELLESIYIGYADYAKKIG
jgi:hypothetical protein